MPAIPEPTAPLTDGWIRLRLAAERDIPDVLVAHQDDPQLHRALSMRRPPSGAELGRQLEQAPAARSAGSEITLTILEPGREDCRGQVRAYGFDWGHGRAELEVWVLPQARCRQLARSSLRLVAAWLFRSCAIERVQLVAVPGNEGLLRAANAAGFVREGTLRSHELERDQPADRAVLSLLRSELEAGA